MVYPCWRVAAGQEVARFRPNCGPVIVRQVTAGHEIEEVRAKIQQAIEPHEDLLTIVKKRKLQWYGHVSR